MPRRYAVREVAPDKWTVYDIFTGWPAKVDGNRMTNIESWEANEFAELLNQQDLTRRAKAGISGLWFQPPTSAPPGYPESMKLAGRRCYDGCLGDARRRACGLRRMQGRSIAFSSGRHDAKLSK